MNKETETKKSARKNHLKRLFLCSCAGLALVALPVFCSLNSGKKQPTDEEVLLNWLDKTRKGEMVKKAAPAAQPQKAAESRFLAPLKEEQIKEADKADDGWWVLTNENRMRWVDKTDVRKK